MSKQKIWRNILVFLINIGEILGHNEESSLKRLLFTNYDRSTRPVKDYTTPTPVAVSLMILSLTKVDEANEALTVTLDFGMRWRDEYLTWNNSSYGGISNITVLAESIWIPDVTFTNADEITHIFPTNQRYVIISSDGSVRYSSMQHVTIQCHYKVKDFPFDAQKCKFDIELWIFQLHIIPLTVIEDYEASTMGYIQNHPEWEPLSFKWTEGITNVSNGNGSDRLYSHVHYELSLKRWPLYFISTVMLPSYIVTSVCLVGLFMPSNSAGLREEKVTLGLTTLLAMAMILNIATNQIPKSGDGIATLALIIVLELSLASVATLITVLLLMFHERAVSRQWMIPKWLGGTDRKKKLAECVERRLTLSEIVEANKASSKPREDKLYKAIKSCNRLLENLKAKEDQTSQSDEREAKWCKIFDRIDMLMLVLFQTANVLISYVILQKYL